MSLSITSATVSVAIVAVVLHAWWERRNALPNLPVPSNPSFIWGHQKAEFEDNGGQQWRAWFKECGKAFRIKAAWGHRDILILADTAAVSHVFSKNPYNYAHPPIFRAFVGRLTGHSLLWVEGASEHRRMKSLVAPAFSRENVRNIGPIIYQVASHMQDHLASQLQSSESIELNVFDLTGPAALDVIGKAAFGYDFNAIEHGHHAVMIMDMWRHQNEMGVSDAGFKATMTLQLLPWITYLPLKALKAQAAIVNHIREFAKEIVDRGEIDTKGGKDLMSLLLRANQREDPAKRVSMEEIYNHVVTFVVAGHETTAGAIAFGLWLLGKNPSMQQLLRDEITSYGGEPSYDELDDPNALPYLDAVCKESIRLFSAGARNEKVAEADDVIPLREPVKGTDGSWITSIPVKKGQIIHIPGIAIDRDEDVWGDADTFRPTRWLVGGPFAEKYCTPGERGLLPAGQMCGGWAHQFSFSEGPRTCIGIKLALFEYKVLMLTLIKHFRFHDTGAELELRFAAALTSRVVGKQHEGINLPVRVTLV
ncbi:cytochrome P450 [Serendipita vermifera]|nr:cytochrome P450 [Serendipita vermifera]